MIRPAQSPAFGIKQKARRGGMCYNLRTRYRIPYGLVVDRLGRTLSPRRALSGRSLRDARVLSSRRRVSQAQPSPKPSARKYLSNRFLVDILASLGGPPVLLSHWWQVVPLPEPRDGVLSDLQRGRNIRVPAIFLL